MCDERATAAQGHTSLSGQPLHVETHPCAISGQPLHEHNVQADRRTVAWEERATASHESNQTERATAVRWDVPQMMKCLRAHLHVTTL